jgi:hypothetical protein
VSAVIFGDLEDKLEVLQVACSKCERRGQYPVARLIERYGRDAKLSSGRTRSRPPARGGPTPAWS